MAMKRKAMRRPYRRRTYRKKARTTMTKAVKTNLMSCVRSYVAIPFTSTYPGSGWTYVNYTFSLGGVPGYTEFVNLFDQYRINAVKLTFLPQFTGNDFEDAVANNASSVPWIQNPRVHYCIDRSGIQTGTINSESKMLEYSSARTVKRPFEPFSIYVKSPSVHLGTATGVIIVGGAPKSKQWIDTDNYGIVHHGCAIGMQIPGGATNTTYGYEVMIKLYMQFKSVH